MILSGSGGGTVDLALTPTLNLCHSPHSSGWCFVLTDGWQMEGSWPMGAPRMGWTESGVGALGSLNDRACCEAKTGG